MIKLSELVVHRYTDNVRLMKRADQIARDIIHGELRQGEAMRCPRPGIYQLLLPNLTPSAGALWCSVIRDRIYREVRKLNPSSHVLDNEVHTEKPPAPSVLDAPSPAAHTPNVNISEALAERAKQKSASLAFARMAEDKTGVRDLELTDEERDLLAAFRLAFHPVWHTKNKLITAYNCILSRDGTELTAKDLPGPTDETSADVRNGKIDVATYAQAVKAAQFLLGRNMKALLIVPIHFSTIDRLRYMTPLLAAAGEVPESAKNLLVFELVDLPRDLTRFRLREPVGYLHSRARALIARTGLGASEFELFKEFGFHGVSVNLPDFQWPESRLMVEFDRFAAAADQHHLQSFVHGIAHTSLVLAATGAGFSYMEGSAIAEPVHHPDSIRPFEIDMLYAE